MPQQFVLPHTISQIEILVLLDRTVTNTHSVNMLCPNQKNCLLLQFRNNITCWNAGILGIGHELLVYWASVMSFLSAVKFCIGGIRKIAVSWAINLLVSQSANQQLSDSKTRRNKIPSTKAFNYNSSPVPLMFQHHDIWELRSSGLFPSD
jgi:hypothetical protein